MQVEGGQVVEGGRFYKQGADTCVYLDPPVQCIPGTVKAGPFYDANDKSLVSRISHINDDEFKNQVEVQSIVNKLEIKYPTLNFKDNFQIALATCQPRMTANDLVGTVAGKQKMCTVKGLEGLQTAGDKPNFVNFLTRRQGGDLGNKVREITTPSQFLKAFVDLMNATVALNSEGVVHFDLHPWNVAWSVTPWPNKKLLMTDWGRSVIGYENFIDSLVKSYDDEDAKLNRFDLTQFENQFKVVSTLIGKDSVETVAKRYEASETADPNMTPFKKLFYAWDTYSLLHLIGNKVSFTEFENFKGTTVHQGSRDTDINLSSTTATELLDQLIVSTKIPKDSNGLKILVQEIWNIISYLFKSATIYKHKDSQSVNVRKRKSPTRIRKTLKRSSAIKRPRRKTKSKKTTKRKVKSKARSKITTRRKSRTSRKKSKSTTTTTKRRRNSRSKKTKTK